MRPKLPFRKPRCRAKDGPAFVFVDASESQAAGPNNQDARVRIRRQAARSGRKHQRTQNIHSTPQTSGPLVRYGDGLSEAVSRGEALNLPLAPQPSVSGYEALRIAYNFDITLLTSFTDVDLVKTAAVPLQEEPNLLAKLLQQRTTSFLSYLPSRYGSSRCVDDAMRCLAARAGQIFGHPTRPETIAVLYGKALTSLQIALNDEHARLESNVYCATRLLTLYEVSFSIRC